MYTTHISTKKCTPGFIQYVDRFVFWEQKHTNFKSHFMEVMKTWTANIDIHYISLPNIEIEILPE